MWEEVRRQGHVDLFGFRYRGAVGAYWNRLADYHTLERRAAEQVLILRVQSSSRYRGRIVSRDNRGKKVGESRRRPERSSLPLLPGN